MGPPLNFKTMWIKNELRQELQKEMNNAYEKYGHFNSTHEAYAVLQEEVNEFWDLVQKEPIELVANKDISKNIHEWDKKEFMIHELTQVAAIAIRTIIELRERKIKFV